jgi:predicted nucleic acid-binding protein
MIKLYLDSCSLQRPLDDQQQARVRLETEAILALLDQIENKEIVLLNSEVLLYEINRIPNLQRRHHALEMLALSDIKIKLDTFIEQRANELQQYGIKPLDALHLATAEQANADYFCTCDDRFLKRAQTLKLNTCAISPLQLLMELDL